MEGSFEITPRPLQGASKRTLSKELKTEGRLLPS